MITYVLRMGWLGHWKLYYESPGHHSVVVHAVAACPVSLFKMKQTWCWVKCKKYTHTYVCISKKNCHGYLRAHKHILYGFSQSENAPGGTHRCSFFFPFKTVTATMQGHCPNLLAPGYCSLKARNSVTGCCRELNVAS